jgi:hypothetical protein
MNQYQKFIILTIVIVILNLNQCAFMNSSNRILTNQLDSNIQPSETYQEILLAPLIVPVGTASLLVDGFVLHPMSVVPKAIAKTYEIIWIEPSGGIIRQSFLFIPKIAFTPIAFAFSWLGYALFDI